MATIPQNLTRNHLFVKKLAKSWADAQCLLISSGFCEAVKLAHVATLHSILLQILQTRHHPWLRPVDAAAVTRRRGTWLEARPRTHAAHLWGRSWGVRRPAACGTIRKPDRQWA